jgi:hypothetical protein
MLEGRPHIGLPALSSADVIMAFEVSDETKVAGPRGGIPRVHGFDRSPRIRVLSHSLRLAEGCGRRSVSHRGDPGAQRGGSRCGAGGANIDGSLVRLYVDDVPRAPIAWVNTTIAINEAKRPHLALQLPGRRRPAPDPLRVRGSRASLGERGSLGCRGSLTGVVSSGAELLES